MPVASVDGQLEQQLVNSSAMGRQVEAMEDMTQAQSSLPVIYLQISNCYRCVQGIYYTGSSLTIDFWLPLS